MRFIPKIFISSLSGLILMAILFSCKKQVEYPIIPAIDFKRIEGVKDANGRDQSIKVTIGFTDGDGDIGYYSVESGKNDHQFDFPADNTNPYYNNFKVKTFRKVNGIWSIDPVDISARIPYLTPEGSNKALKGEIERDLPVRPGLVRDTFYYEIFIWDRGLHASNTVTTSQIILTTQ